jgi:electron transport complex protein RnfG
MTRTILIPAFVLTVATFIAALSLSHIREVTQPRIEKQQREKQQRALSTVLPGFEVKEKITADIDGKEFTYWPAEKDGSKGYAFISSEPGYSGDIRVMVGVNERGKVLGISILQQTETPGLGARCTEVASTTTFFGKLFGKGGDEEPGRPWFQKQFSGLDLTEDVSIVQKGDWDPSMREELLEENAISSITGATITAKAVIDAIDRGMTLLQKEVEIPAPEEEKDENGDTEQTGEVN